MPSKREVLNLYKQLLRYGQHLQNTDKTYFQQRIVNEFKTNKQLSEDKAIKFSFEKGQQLLKRGLVL